MSPAKSSSARVRLFVSLILLLGAAIVFLQRQQIFDQIVVWQFKPTAAISAITSRSSMNDTGRFLFYATQPALLDRENFNNACRSLATEQTAVLGCYVKNQIYVFDITNAKLDGIEEVTSAHEMLHAAYQRLSVSERDKVDALVEKQSHTLGADQARIDELMVSYEQSEPGERLNELHSIIGSEVASLDPALETYYTKYFSDRSKVVALSQQYQTVFNELKNRQDTLVTEITALADKIEQDSSTYKRNLQVLGVDIRAFNDEASSGSMSSQTYARQRAALELRQAQLKNNYDSIQTLLSEYDKKHEELAAINSESDVLNRSINSALSPVSETIDE